MKRRANTKEDIVPDWARQRIRKLGQYPGDQLPSELMPMCSDCNGTFGRKFEDVTAPVLGPVVEGEDHQFSVPDQYLTARWIVKTMLLFQLARADLTVNQLMLARDILSDMKVKKGVPGSALVRVGSIDPHDAQGLAHEDTHTLGSLPETAVFAVSSLGWLVWEMALGDANHMEPFVRSCVDNELFLRVWPPQVTSLQWPPAAHCMESDLHKMRQAWTAKSWPPPPDQALSGPGSAFGFARTVWEGPETP